MSNIKHYCTKLSTHFQELTKYAEPEAQDTFLQQKAYPK